MKVISYYHKNYPLSKHQSWVDFWKQKDWVELSAHGHYHSCERNDIGECEFFEMDTIEKAKDRIDLCLSEWESIGHKPSGWRNPGWLAHPNAVSVIGKHFDYAALHKEHNHNLEWECSVIFGCDGINGDRINIENDIVDDPLAAFDAELESINGTPNTSLLYTSDAADE